jgi:hypothetical protein
MTGVALDIEALTAEARRRTGLWNYGDTWFLEPLAVLLASMRDEAELNDMGRAIYGERLITGLVNRLRIRAFLDRHPEVADVPVNVAAVIVGLGRSGSTLLHRLMAEAEEATAVQWWETLNPVPLDGEVAGRPEERRAIAREAVEAMLAADLPPAVDFALFRPNGKKIQRQLKFKAVLFSPDGQFRTVEQPGPGSYQAWRQCYALLRTTLLLLKVVAVQVMVIEAPMPTQDHFYKHKAQAMPMDSM